MSSPSRSGVFQQSADRRLEEFTESIHVDRRLYAQDIAGSIAHAQMLAQAGLLTPEECQAIEQALREIEGQLSRGELPLRIELEDIHMHVEQALIDRLGDVGRKLHTARSRNDQVVTDLRLWSREAIDRVDERVRQLQRSFVDRCEADLQVILPAYTHLQRAAGARSPLLARLLRETAARSGAVAGLPAASECVQPGSGRVGGNKPADRSRRRGPAVGI